MCKRDAESVKVVPESVLSNRGHLEGTHLAGESSLPVRFLPGVVSGGISVHRAQQSFLFRSRSCIFD